VQVAEPQFARVIGQFIILKYPPDTISKKIEFPGGFSNIFSNWVSSRAFPRSK
jgi:hypothetical protein